MKIKTFKNKYGVRILCIVTNEEYLSLMKIFNQISRFISYKLRVKIEFLWVYKAFYDRWFEWRGGWLNGIEWWRRYE